MQLFCGSSSLRMSECHECLPIAAGRMPAAGKLSGEIVVPEKQASGKPPLASTSATSLASQVDPREVGGPWGHLCPF